MVEVVGVVLRDGRSWFPAGLGWVVLPSAVVVLPQKPQFCHSCNLAGVGGLGVGRVLGLGSWFCVGGFGGGMGVGVFLMMIGCWFCGGGGSVVPYSCSNFSSPTTSD